MVDLLTGETGLPMEMDTRASVAIVSKETWKTIHSTSLEPSMVQLKTYSVNVLGQRLVKVQHGAQVANLPLMFVQGKGPSLHG